MSGKSSEMRICAIGLDHFGYKLRPKTMDAEGFRLDFLSKDEALSSNLDYDGLIIPSGIFERFTSIPDRDGPRVAVQSDPELLKKMESRVIHQLERGRWVCFLVDEITDRINEDHPKVRATVVNDTSLCKRMLNKYGVTRNLVQTVGSIEVRSPFFLSYAQKFATPKTVFNPPSELSVREIISSSAGLLGFTISNQLFFLPFFKNYSRSLEVADPIVQLYQAIQEYIDNPNAQNASAQEMPDWAAGFVFNSEQSIQNEQTELKKKLEHLKSELAIYQNFKALLVQTGEELENSVELALGEFFGLSLTKKKSSFCIEENGQVIAIVASDSCNGSVARSMMNEVDNIRESLQLPHSSTAILVVNDYLEANSLQEKEAGVIDRDKREHAHRQNIILLRSIELLKLMKDLEAQPVLERKKEFIRLIQNGGFAQSPKLKSFSQTA